MQISPSQSSGPLTDIIKFLAIVGIMTIFGAGFMAGFVLAHGL
jgi:hypothetical protein